MTIAIPLLQCSGAAQYNQIGFVSLTVTLKMVPPLEKPDQMPAPEIGWQGASKLERATECVV